ncbi:MAG: DUF1990 domain-containing protein [Bryobacteraceae bacterium]
MFTLPRPSGEKLRAVLEQQDDAPFSYADVGITRGLTVPVGYHADQYRIQLGSGESTFDAARTAMEQWKMFDRSWIGIFPENPPIRDGATIAVVPAHLGFYSINVCRIVYAINSGGPVREFGFAYGTLPEHAASGEELFKIRWDRGDNSVWYEITAFSKPRAVLARIGYPISRLMQNKFRRTSGAAMMAASA